MVKGQTTSYYATGGGLNKYQLVGVDIGFTPLTLVGLPILLAILGKVLYFRASNVFYCQRTYGVSAPLFLTKQKSRVLLRHQRLRDTIKYQLIVVDFVQKN